MPTIGFVAPWDRITETISQGAGQAIEEGGAAAGSAVLSEGMALATENAASLAFSAGLGALGSVALPTVAAAAALGHVVASKNIERVEKYIDSRGRSARQFAGMAAYLTDSNGNVDLKKVEEVKTMPQAQINDLIGEKSMLHKPFWMRFRAGMESVGYHVKALFGANKDDARAKMRNTNELKKIDRLNWQYQQHNSEKRQETARKLVSAFGYNATKGARAALVDFAQSEEFKPFTDSIFGAFTTEKAGEAAHYMAKSATKGVVDGALEAAEENEPRIKKQVGNVIDGAAKAVSSPQNQEIIKETSKNVAAGVLAAAKENKTEIKDHASNAANGAAEGVLNGINNAFEMPKTRFKNNPDAPDIPLSKGEQMRNGLATASATGSLGLVPAFVAGVLTFGTLVTGTEAVARACAPQYAWLARAAQWGLLDVAIVVPWMKQHEDAIRPNMLSLYDHIVDPAHAVSEFAKSKAGQLTAAACSAAAGAYGVYRRFF